LSKTGTDKNNTNKAQVTYKGNKTGTDKNNNNKAQVTYKGNKTGTDKNNNNKAQAHFIVYVMCFLMTRLLPLILLTTKFVYLRVPV
jgi:hypothetical protein